MGNLGAAGDPREAYKRLNSPPPAKQVVQEVFTPRGDTVVTQAYSAVAKVRDMHSEHLDAVNRDEGLTEQGRADAVAGFANTSTAAYLDTVQEAVDQRVELARNDYQQRLAGLSPDGDSSQELRNSRAWVREKRKLDAAGSNPLALSLARQALERADAATLGVLLQELPAYLESRKIPVDWVNPVVTQKLPELGQAQHQVHQAQQAKVVLDHDIAAIRKGIQSGHPPSFLVDPSRFDPDIPTQ
jgi:hypothetical protein